MILKRIIGTCGLLLAMINHSVAQDAAPEVGPPETGLVLTPDLPEAQNPTRVQTPFNPFLFSVGYVFGRIVQAEAHGWPWRRFLARVNLGLDSVPGGILDPDCVDLENVRLNREVLTPIQRQTRRDEIVRTCTNFINPWRLASYSPGWQAYLERLGPQPVMIHFSGWVVSPFLHSSYHVRDVLPANPHRRLRGTEFGSYEEGGEGIPIWGRVRTGAIEGRVVVATRDGIIRRANQIIVQRSAAEFLQFGVPNRELFDFIVEAMATGNLMNLLFYEPVPPAQIPANLLRGYDTNQRVYRVQVYPNTHGAAPR